MSSSVAETPTTPTPSSFHPGSVAPTAHHHESATATPKPIYIPSSVSSVAPELRHVTSHPKFTGLPTSKTGKLAPLVDGHKTPSGLSPNHIPATLNLSPATHPARLGSRSSSSIPSSPNSVHSSSSAIFERDIEPIPTLSLAAPSPTHAVNPHRIPRVKATEAIETSVPSVLDSAVSALNDDPSSVTVLSSAPQLVCSPGSLPSAGSGTSSGSPPVMSLLLQGMGMSGLMSASASVSGAASVSGFTSGFASPIASSRAPSPARSASPLGDASGSPTRNLAISTVTNPPAAPSSPVKKASVPGPANPSAQAVKSTNRLSFISYTDLLTSAPIAAQPLSAVLAPGATEPPTHVVVINDEDTGSTRGRTGYAGSQVGDAKGDREGEKDVDSLGVVGMGGGEWEREKMGWGLEERLERMWVAEKEAREATLRAPTKGERERSPASRSLDAAVAGAAAAAA